MSVLSYYHHHCYYSKPATDLQFVSSNGSSTSKNRFNFNFVKLFSPPIHSATFRTRSPIRPSASSSTSPSSSSSMPLNNLTSPSTSTLISELQQDSLFFSRAYWVSESLIAWNVDVRDGSCYLYSSHTAVLYIAEDGILGEDIKIKLEEDKRGLPASVIKKFPHIKDYRAFKVPTFSNSKSLFKTQLAVVAFNSDGKCTNSTGLQLPGVLDELFAYDGPLGAVFTEESVSLYLWAPTAQAVRAFIYTEPSGGAPKEIADLVEVNGVWSMVGPRSWEGFYYVYEVSVYHPSTLHIEKCYANDPYARGLSSNAQRTLLINLDSNCSKPDGWDELAEEKPAILSASDISIYELHIRDFSASDNTVHPQFRGCYLAFTSQESAGVHHLKKLSNAGITHVHLLPTFQFGGVDDEKEKWKYAGSQILSSLGAS